LRAPAAEPQGGATPARRGVAVFASPLPFTFSACGGCLSVPALVGGAVKQEQAKATRGSPPRGRGTEAGGWVRALRVRTPAFPLHVVLGDLPYKHLARFRFLQWGRIILPCPPARSAGGKDFHSGIGGYRGSYFPSGAVILYGFA